MHGVHVYPRLYAAVHEGAAGRFDDVRKIAQELPLGSVAPLKLGHEFGKVELRRYLNAHLMQHIPHEPASSVRHIFDYAR